MIRKCVVLRKELRHRNDLPGVPPANREISSRRGRSVSQIRTGLEAVCRDTGQSATIGGIARTPPRLRDGLRIGMNWVARIRGSMALTLLVGVLALAVISCAPASGGGGGEVVSNGGLAVGQASPPFAMTLADGSSVDSNDLIANDRPAHLFWFATW